MSATMNRKEQWDRLEGRVGQVDLLIIGGGATGLGAAVDAAKRGLSVVLVERDDFAAGTSSRSTKLVHGGVRYLRQGQVSLVRDSLRERGRLLNNAPGLVHKLRFVIPCKKYWEKPFYGMGMATYDLLAGQFGWEHSTLLSRDETLRHLPGVSGDQMLGGVEYLDGQFNDARLALALARTAICEGAIVINHAEVMELKKVNGKVIGAVVRDRLIHGDGTTGERSLEISARVVISAAGVFSDSVAKLANPGAEAMVTVAQGTHIVLDRSFFPGDCALMVPKTDDGRVLFMIPWLGHVLVGTTDTAVSKVAAEPVALEEEIAYLLDYSGRYLMKKPTKADIKSRFAGLRPLVKPLGKVKSTSSVSRDHQIFVDDTGLITIVGGKWTTYRQMSEDVINRAEIVGDFVKKACQTKDMRIEEGADAQGYDRQAELQSGQIVAELPLTELMVRRMAREEMAETVADVLARRERALFVDADAAVAAAGRVSQIMAEEKGWSAPVMERQKSDFQRLALGYRAEGI
ncbi:MAG: FAD-dependent oxidoreductase [Planctomycetota bacterium]